ncbi:polysaccharide deacetylase family protein [Pseudoduganella danionis]|uniref:Polysaccharide deacetylase family protein n=1 Tax=Pseudoduganella danionis TaxID=1890295 RepID=A0ABW9SM86_9BURK|nr:polysaccharide deacetylase family protein [Pseudoduganella danionis]MTW33100.1 polysaccharide deacetylase family protein [Pseudoduganella danionis]
MARAAALTLCMLALMPALSQAESGVAKRAAVARAAGIAAAYGYRPAVGSSAGAAGSKAAIAPAVTAITSKPAAPSAATAMLAVVPAAAAASVPAASAAAKAAQAAPECKGNIYLTFDTGSQAQAALIAETLQKHHIKASFFLANEKTVNGDYSLDPAWAPYWKARLAEGHVIGSHTFDHDVLVRDGADGKLETKPGFGSSAGKLRTLSSDQYCEQIRRVDQRFVELTGSHLDPVWRAPAGRTSPRALAAARSCGYTHVGWSPAGFSGDELPSEKYSNASLLAKSLRELRAGDVVLIHMGIWSRKDAWAPANLEPLIKGLAQKGYCFATLRDHPDYSSSFKHP